MKTVVYQLLFSGAAAAAVLIGPERAAGELAPRVRQPIALVCADGGKTVLVANRRSGSISIVDAPTGRVVAEHEVGRGLSDLAVLKGGRRLLAVDEASNELLLLEYRDRAVRVLDRLQVSPDPARLALLSDGASCALASRWSRRLTFVSVAKGSAGEDAALAATGVLELPFCPGELARSGDGSKLVVADAFGGRLAVVESVRTMPAHNIRGMAFAPDGKSLVIAHQYLNHLAQTTFDDVHWGLLIRNHLRVLRTDRLFAAGSDRALLDSGRLFDLGDVGYAAGDPGSIAFSKGGDVIVALSGVDEIAIAASPEQGPRRIVVGHRPAAVAPSPDGSVVFVANRLDDTVSTIELKSGIRIATISLGPPLLPTADSRGERLFFSAKLSHDGWMSCHSCHSDGHTNNLLSDTLGDGSYGAPKRVPSLLGVAATEPWTWIGSMARLEDQVSKSIATTMYGTKLKDSQIADLKAYLETLSPPSRNVAQPALADSPAVALGRAVFNERKCAACHATPEYTSPGKYDVGLADGVGNREFNPPSLRGASSRDSFLHDGRARSLEEVFQKEKHPRGLVLSPREIMELVAFLKTL
jgi:cytochrome c peroxidase/DNA-binding beta-propeller fold protein YncE